MAWCFSKIATISMWPFSIATCKGLLLYCSEQDIKQFHYIWTSSNIVAPLKIINSYNLITLSFISTSAPCVINMLTTSVWPSSAATYKGLLPYCSEQDIKQSHYTCTSSTIVALLTNTNTNLKPKYISTCIYYNFLTIAIVSTLAPCVIKIVRISMWPFSTTTCKGLLPYCSEQDIKQFHYTWTSSNIVSPLQIINTNFKHKYISTCIYYSFLTQSFVFVLAPCFSKIATISMWPFSAATCKGLLPDCSEQDIKQLHYTWTSSNIVALLEIINTTSEDKYISTRHCTSTGFIHILAYTCNFKKSIIYYLCVHVL